MYEWRTAKVDGNTRKAFELATDIAWRFDDEKIRSAYVIFAALNILDSSISKIIMDANGIMIPDLDLIMEDKKLFGNIFGKEIAEKIFAEREEMEEEMTAANATKDEPPTENERIEATVMNFLADLMGYGDDEMDILMPVYSDKLEASLDEAYLRCKAMGLDYLTLDVIIYSLLQNEESSAYKFVNGFVNGLGWDMPTFMNSLRIVANITDEADHIERPVIIPAALETCVEVLNAKYKKGDEIVILGRDKEIYKAFNIFSKKTKRNAVLVGKPGVGKTAIIEAITQHIVNETCPAEFVGYTVLSLDVNAMVAGTKYRGEFETKVAILKQFLENTPKVILFVDEMHQMLGAGGTSDGNVDLSGSLKPILSRDDVVFVGATTNKEYDMILSRDGAFKRRFEVIVVKEPKNGEVKVMIEAKIKSMERYHKVEVPRELVDYVILCSNCFNLENANPDKTLDLLDRAMAIAKVDKKTVVTRECIDKVYEECFEKYGKISKADVRSTAYHEVGHYIVNRLTKLHGNVNVTAISIIPAEDYLGVNILEDNDNIVMCDREYVEAYIMARLAGRVAQLKVNRNLDSGASNDIMVAQQFAKIVVTQYGMEEDNFKNLFLMDSDLMSEKLANEINEKVAALIKECYDKTIKFIDEHWEILKNMAEYLIEKRIVTSDELDQFIPAELK